MPRSIDVLSTVALTTNVANIERPVTVIKDLITRGKNAQFTDVTTLEYGTEERRKSGGAYIPRDARAIYIGERDRQLQTIETVNQAFMKSLHPRDLYESRTAGEAIHIGPGGGGTGRKTHRQRLQETITKGQADMVDRFVESSEWWCSRLLVGSLTYSDNAYDAFEYDFGKPGTHTLAAGIFWDQAGAKPGQDLQAAKKVGASFPDFFDMSIGLCAPDVAAHIRESEYWQKRLDNRNLDEARGASFLTNQFAYDAQGSLSYLGKLNGIELWEYDNAINMTGTPVQMIRQGFIEIFRVGRDNGIEEWYSSHHDFDVREGAPIRTQIFSKAFNIKYPSQKQMVAATRPLIFPKRRGWSVSLQVLA